MPSVRMREMRHSGNRGREPLLRRGWSGRVRRVIATDLRASCASTSAPARRGAPNCAQVCCSRIRCLLRCVESDALGRVRYEPSGWMNLRGILRAIDVSPDAACVDLGSGKGRVVLDNPRSTSPRTPARSQVARAPLQRDRPPDDDDDDDAAACRRPVVLPETGRPKRALCARRALHGSACSARGASSPGVRLQSKSNAEWIAALRTASCAGSRVPICGPSASVGTVTMLSQLTTHRARQAHCRGPRAPRRKGHGRWS